MSKKRNEEIDWDSVIDRIQQFMIWFIIILITVTLAVLILFDMLAGTGVMMFLSNNNVAVSASISLATSGLLVAVMFVSYEWMTSNKGGKSQKWTFKRNGIGVLLGLAVFGSFCLDVYFDSLTADYIRFREIVTLSSLPDGDIQPLFRTLIGSISVVGEPLAMAMVLGMPVLKKVLSKSLPSSTRTGGKGKGYTQNKSDRNHQKKSSRYAGQDGLIEARLEQAQKKRRGHVSPTYMAMGDEQNRREF